MGRHAVCLFSDFITDVRLSELERPRWVGIRLSALTAQTIGAPSAKALFDLAGPVAGEFEKTIYTPTYDLLAKEDKKSEAGKHLTDALRHFMPGQSLWYGRLAFERLFLDNLEQMIDGPDASKRWRDAEKKMRKEQHRGFWWKRGESAPG